MANVRYLRCEKCGCHAAPRPFNTVTGRLAECGTSTLMRCRDCAGKDGYATLCRDCCPTGHGTRFDNDEEVKAAIITSELKCLIRRYGAASVGDVFRKIAESANDEFKLTDEEAEALSRYAEAYEDMGPIDIHDLQINLEFPWETKRRAEEFVEQLKGDEVQPPYPR